MHLPDSKLNQLIIEMLIFIEVWQMQLYSTQQLIFAHALQDLQEFFQLSVCS